LNWKCGIGIVAAREKLRVAHALEGLPRIAGAMEQGRLAGCHMFGKPSKMMSHLIPYGIYSIPEISMVGATEEELTRQKAPYEIGLARYTELAKGQMLGDENGLLKILFDPNTLKLLGVHIIGDRAAEIIHIGQAVLTWARPSNISRYRLQLSNAGRSVQSRRPRRL
jgi:pyruvate/2-oxoglutarate dehydrogenase complex dihydrolipoamide dehydrogenase (E3) component